MSFLTKVLTIGSQASGTILTNTARQYTNIGITLAPQSLSSIVHTFPGFGNDEEAVLSQMFSAWTYPGQFTEWVTDNLWNNLAAEPFNFANLNGPGE